MKKIIYGFLLCSNLFGCKSVKEYEKQNINDEQMALSAQKMERFETTYQVYREGASGANGGKSGGGCGCN
ncbi:MAG: DUF4266 domain-containing protein [Flavobacterium sp.]